MEFECNLQVSHGYSEAEFSADGFFSPLVVNSLHNGTQAPALLGPASWGVLVVMTSFLDL